MANNENKDFIEETIEIVENTIGKVSNFLGLGKTIIVFICVGILGLILSFISIPMLSALPAILANVGLGLLVFYIIDRWVLKEVDTLGEIKKGNISYAILLLSFAIIILASILAT
jgi:hypothetical protein